ncbi:MAG: hypothetical protein IKJ05_08240 [Oscillospiraceae bacterium]|nr:hypothetical protein [Oscillospiraceae bacterium]
MKELNTFQRQFMQEIAAIQEETVQIALVEKGDNSLKTDYYNITAETIIHIMELLDGYRNSDMGTISITCEKNGEQLKNNPYIELHDAVCNYLKGI